MALTRVSIPLLALLLLVAGCGGERTVDWTAPENLVLWEHTSETDQGVKIEYGSLVDAPAQKVYEALADVEHYPDFIPGVSYVQVLMVGENSKTVQIAQQVIGRQTNAKVEWKFYPEQRRIEFRTIQSSLSLNDGSYEVEPSPDGRRCFVRTTFLVRPGAGGGSVPAGVLASTTREAFLAAAEGVRRRATGQAR
jgi:ribosome-associated toxin RatA of RatAB toxin-antitoxin module